VRFPRRITLESRIAFDFDLSDGSAPLFGHRRRIGSSQPCDLQQAEMEQKGFEPGKKREKD
jgi:hypothetical protein